MKIDSDEPIQPQLELALAGCDIWHKSRHKYDVALSFAGTDREFAEALAQQLTERSVKIFYDKYENEKLVGADLFSALYDVYRNECRFCVMVISKDYVTRPWPQHERTAIQNRIINERPHHFLIPIKLDQTDLPGFSSIGHLWGSREFLKPGTVDQNFEVIVETILTKLWIRDAERRKGGPS